MVTGSVCGPPAYWYTRTWTWTWMKGSTLCRTFLAEYDVLKLGVFFFQTCKNLLSHMWQRAKEETHFLVLLVCRYLSRRLWVRVGELLQFLLRVYTCVSAEQHPPPPSPSPDTPPRARRSHKRQAGRLRDRSLVSCQKSEKYITASGYLRQSAGINVGRLGLSRGDGSRDEGATARVLTAERPIEAYWYCGLENVAPSPLDAGTRHPSVDLPWYIDEMDPKGSRVPTVPSGLPVDVQVIILWEFITVM